MWAPPPPPKKKPHIIINNHINHYSCDCEHLWIFQFYLSSESVPVLQKNLFCSVVKINLTFNNSYAYTLVNNTHSAQYIFLKLMHVCFCFLKEGEKQPSISPVYWSDTVATTKHRWNGSVFLSDSNSADCKLFVFVNITYLDITLSIMLYI